MEPLSLIALIITIVASGLGVFAKLFTSRKPSQDRKIEEGERRLSDPFFPDAAKMIRQQPAPPPPSGRWVLYIFAVIVIAFGVFALVHYWGMIQKDTDTWLFAAGLFLVMAAGMFVQVLATNYRAGRGLFEVTASQLIFPLLFALIVYYPIWVLAASSSRNLFSFYAAFLNGYFWESVVSAAKRPTPNGLRRYE